MTRAAPQLICFSYHKSGTSLFLHVMTKVCAKLGLRLANHYGLVERLDPEPDVVLLPHSVLRGGLDRPYRAIRLIRDPRDIWVSGYLYHLRCDEEWCRNTNTEVSGPIQWPQVDYSVVHWPEAWKHRYLERLNGRSYQQNLLDRSVADGLDFELEGYTGCTLTAMREWGLNGAVALDVKLEDVMADFDAAMLRIFVHFEFTEDECQAALEVARTEDVRRMDDSAMAARPQIHSRTISKWRHVLSPVQIKCFEDRHGDLIRELGYDTGPDANACRAAQTYRLADRSRSNPWAEGTGDEPTVHNNPHDAELRLSADGIAISPTAADGSIYRFVVPSGCKRLRLESRFGCEIGPGRLGVRVSEIAIRSAAGEVVIAADDPSLTTGWHAAERVGDTLWRWTNGSAELPWGGVCGPAIVIVRCLTP